MALGPAMKSSKDVGLTPAGPRGNNTCNIKKKLTKMFLACWLPKNLAPFEIFQVTDENKFYNVE